jgi:methionyl-tRNA synthetase
LAILLAPFIPDTSSRTLDYLNINETVNELGWNNISEESVKTGIIIKKPKPLFQKLDIIKIQENLQKLKEKGGKESNLISYNNFKNLKILIGVVEKVEPVPKADKLYKLTVNIGKENRTLVAGLAEHYKPEDLLNKKIVVLTNLEPKKLRGIMSQGMLLAAVKGDNVSVLTPSRDIEPGAKIE